MSNKLPDTGERTEYPSGAVREALDSKGRCDLLPLNILNKLYEDDTLLYCYEVLRLERTNARGELLKDVTLKLVEEFISSHFNSKEEALLEVAIHYADGARKYDERNWEKGLPTWSFIDSGVRHYLKLKAGFTDEPHDRAVLWNLLGYAWTINENLKKKKS